MMGGGVLVVLLLELGGFSEFSGFWVKPNVIDRVLRPMVFIEHASGFRVAINGVGEGKLVKF